ncbi:hypothetical protein EDB86DRAFT_2833237 [Lactarius hatsudake]|nr:hypothetical protein EDB86DRAFT_2833237 [Lactarius hatsudake]
MSDGLFHNFALPQLEIKHQSHYLMVTYLPQETNSLNVKGGVRLLQECDSQVWYQALQVVPEIEIVLSKGKEKKRNSGLNPSGNPSGSQLNRPVEIIQIPPLTSNIASLPPVAPVAPDAASLLPVVPDAAPLSPVAPDAASLAPVTSDAAPLPLFDSHNSTSNANFTRVYNFTAAQGDDGFGHHDSELSSNAMDYLRGSNNTNILSDRFQVYSHHSTTNLDTASLLHDPFPAHHSMTNTSSLLPEQPLRPGEVTRGGITQPLPVSAWRIASAGPDQPQVPSSSRSGPNVIRGSGTRVDVLAHRHGRRPPYRLPPTPALTSPSEVSFPDNSRASSPTSTLTSTMVRRQAARSQQSQPDDCQEALSYVKHQYRLNLLTVNAMWPDLIAKVHANDQLLSVVRDGSNLRNEFKSMARQLVWGNSYNIFLAQYQSPEDARQYTANKVAALLNQATGAWMHNGVDEKGIKNYFEHPAVEETIVCTIFATPRSIGSRYSDKFGSLCTPTLALACCALCCALEEWCTSTYSAVTFEVAVYRSLYHSIADLNIQQLLKKPYLRSKLMALWARIYNRGCQMVVSQRGGPARTVQLFVEDIEDGQLAESDLDDALAFPTDEPAQNMGWQL